MKKITGNVIEDSADGLSKNWHTPYDQYFTRDYYGSPKYVPENNLPVQALFVHEEHCYNNYYRKRENSEVFAVEFVLEGSMIFTQNEKTYRVNPGQVYLVHLDRDNELYPGPEKYCHRLACGLTGGSLNSILNTTGLSKCDVIQLQNSNNIENLMRSCLEEFKNMAPEFRKRTSFLIYQILIELSENLNKSNMSELTCRAIKVMEHHLSQRLSLNKLADILGSSRSTLNRVFQSDFKESPINYFIHLKIEAAKSMLINTDLQVQEIAMRVGYDNALHFSTEFRKRIGVSPRQYRK